MDPQTDRTGPRIDTANWKEIAIEYAGETLRVRVPPQCDILAMKEVPPLADPRSAYAAALAAPIGGPPLAAIIAARGKPAGEMTAAITVSDITRPVPYKGENGFLGPFLASLAAAGIARDRTVIVVGNGMHRPSTAAEKVAILGEAIVRDYRVVDHDCEDLASLTFVGKSATGGDVFVNSTFCGADLKIATGLVESHFMAGLSGGRKAICPGLVDKRTIEKFHSPAFLESPFAQNLILAGNPCHEESLAIARTVGVDFIVNATLDRELRPTGVFAGDLEAAHAAAGELARETCAIPVDREYDIVVTHGGYVGLNHYQAVKAAHNALPAIRKGGILIVATDNRDEEPIGGPEYKSLLHLLKMQGADQYMRLLTAPGWCFTKDQWEPEMWAKVFRKVAPEDFFYCTHTIPREDYCLIPGRCGLDLLGSQTPRAAAADVATMVQNAVLHAVASYRDRGIEPTVAYIQEGPYAIPYLRERKAAGE